MLRPTIVAFATLALLQTATAQYRKTCLVDAGENNATDDAPVIISAFKDCGHRGRVVFKPTTYYVNSVMNITWLDDVEVDLHGKLLWSTDIRYWLNNSLDVGYQNQSTAFILGDNKYEWIRQQPNTSNYPGRPHAITFNGLRNSIVEGLTFLRSRVWTMSIIYSHYVELDSIFVNNTGNRVSSSNTDGADTIRSSHIKFNNWTVYNGDDSLALKANSTDISITNSRFFNGLGIALGSIGQYKDQYETVERVKVENIHFGNTLHAFYAKTWTNDQNGYPPNGGGGGLGYASGMEFTNLETADLRGAAGNCTSSQFQIRDITITGLKGTTKSSQVASLQCSAVAPCTNISILDTELEFSDGTVASEYLCGNVKDQKGWECTGEVCVGGSATGEC
ncbi:pectin lyase-like protein [Xylaria digitata]|nr:pectin lyase-like protein [Xylaria digitata]